jgi:pyrroline-5-carboxylate reductase
VSLVGIGPVVLIGAGKMGMALARGWVAAGLAPADLVLVDPNPAEATVDFAESLGIRLEPSPVGVLTQVMVMAVKPQVMSGVLAEAKAAVGRQTLVISIAAGISIQTIAQGLGTERVIRTMPNTPAQIGKGITGAVSGSRSVMRTGRSPTT